jgi:uncharacterized protein (DUF1778 family)
VPAKPASQRKSHWIKIRVTADQKKALTKAATRDGQGLSPWLLALGMRAVRS